MFTRLARAGGLGHIAILQAILMPPPCWAPGTVANMAEGIHNSFSTISCWHRRLDRLGSALTPTSLVRRVRGAGGRARVERLWLGVLSPALAMRSSLLWNREEQVLGEHGLQKYLLSFVLGTLSDC